MTLKELLVNICNLAIGEKLVQSAMSGTSLYEINPKTIRAYPLLFVSPTGQHLVQKHTTTYEITLYYLDRLLENNSNDVDVYSTAVEEIKNLVRTVEQLEGVLKVEEGYRITNFADTESFNDRLCGAWATISVLTDNSTECVIRE